MMRRLITLGALVVGLSCGQAQKTDFAILPEVPLSSGFFSYVGPGIWEKVEPRQKTYEGRVEYLVEAIDRNGKVIASYPGSFERPYPDIAGKNAALSELVTILLATREEMERELPAEWKANPRYLIPKDAAAVRITADPNKRIKEQNEDDNSYAFYLRR